jgi:AraC family transcriptional regulator
MPRENNVPKVLAQGTTPEGVALEFRWDPLGVMDVPELEDVLVGVHFGAAAKCTCQRQGKRYAGIAVHGDINIIPAHTPQRWEMHDQNDHTFLVRLPERLLSKVAEQCDLDISRIEIRDRFHIRDAELELVCWAMKRELELGYPSGRLYLDGLALAAASRLISQHSSVTNPRGISDNKEGLDRRRLQRVLAFIEDQLAEDLSLENIAAVAGISPSHLNSLFRISMGMPLHRYVIRRRVERAKSLLMQDGPSMAEVALAAGFAHQSHMAQHMRRVLGMPPRAVKRLLSEGSPCD